MIDPEQRGQYQPTTEPLFVQAAPALTQWQSQTNPTRLVRRSLPTALLAASLAFVPVISAPTVPDLPLWEPRGPVRIARLILPTALYSPSLAFVPLVDNTKVGGGGYSLQPEIIRQYQALTEPVLPPGEVPPLIQAIGPTHFPRRRGPSNLAPSQEMFGVITEVPVQSWLEYAPDQVFYRPWRAQPTSIAQNLDPITNPPSPDLAWRAVYPDRLDRLRALGTSRQQVSVQNLDPIINPASPEVAWLPTYPVRLTRPSLPVAQQQAWAGIAGRAEQQLPGVPNSGGLVIPLLRVQYQAYAGPVVVNLATPLRAWAPTYPSQLASRPFHAALQQASVLNPEPRPSVESPFLAWQPEYPDQLFPLRRLPVALLRTGAFYPEPITAVITIAEWLGSYPSRIDPRPFPVSLRTSLTDPNIVAQTPPPLGWDSVYPAWPRWADWLLKKGNWVTSQQVLAFNPFPVAPVVVADLSWQPEYPDRLDRRPFRTALQQALALNPDPIAGNAFVALSWSPEYPDLLLVRRTPRLGSFTDLFTHTAVVIAGGWEGDYPAQAARRILIPQAPQAALVISTEVIADAVTCLEVGVEDLTQATILSLGVTQADVLHPDETQSGFSVEIC